MLLLLVHFTATYTAVLLQVYCWCCATAAATIAAAATILKCSVGYVLLRALVYDVLRWFLKSEANFDGESPSMAS